ncbi:uncharacterized protein B0H18DRAFT_1122504 [Fomitopsis serialis]|uniref:uncharacterized protein n=1 Tax=Fomitopsis serialis TaxID=139415 RepID=UPI0020082206|nr:uncharacterized protein B0H18DRAFT_1122504 [Neoantrodia serialis]KAH9919385.1 hypothetical protein B0H18DRAFT_1122504 [Neoantrodia serialis]
MGGASSKPVRQFPKTLKPPPTWAGARTPRPDDPGASAGPSRSAPPRASETKDEAIDRDARDPQFAAMLSKLGPVKVDHHMQTVRPAADQVQRVFQARQRSEEDARSLTPTRNRMLAGTLYELLEERKSVTTREELEKLAVRYEIDVDRLENVARFVNSPSVDEGSVRREVDKDGVEQTKMKASWVEPQLRPSRPHVPTG